MGRLQTFTDGALGGKQLGYTYNKRGWRTAMTSTSDAALGTAYGHDGAGRVTSVTRGGVSATLGYDLAGRTDFVSLPNGIRTGYGYDPADRLVSVTHRQGESGPVVASASYLLDNAGNRLKETFQDGSFNLYGYDASYRLTYENFVSSGGSSEARYYRYSPGGDRLKEWAPAWADFEHTWSDDFEREALGEGYIAEGGTWLPVSGEEDRSLERLITDPETAAGEAKVISTAVEVDKPFELSAELRPMSGSAEKPVVGALVFGRTDANNYFLGGARSYSAVPAGENEPRLHVTYFVSRVKAGVAELLAETSEAEVLPVGTGAFKLRVRVTAVTVELARQYGSENWAEKLAAGMPWGASGVPQSKIGLYCTAPAPDAVSYAFDDLTLKWNTTSSLLAEASYEYNACHELQSVTGLGKDASYTYDLDGNRLTETKGGVRHRYGYTFENRLEKVWRGPEGSDVQIRGYTFQGDSWMRRTAVETDGGNTVTTNFLYDGDNAVAEFDGNGALTAHHVTNGLDRTLWSVRGGNLQTPLSSAQNVMAVADSSGAVVASYRYRAFGERVTLSGGAPDRTDPSFQNRSFDQGLGIYDYRNRQFDPATGRFLQRDPVLGGDELFNPYCFPSNNPVGFGDPYGLGFWDDTCYVVWKIKEGGHTVVKVAADWNPVSGPVRQGSRYIRRKLQEAENAAVQSGSPNAATAALTGKTVVGLVEGITHLDELPDKMLDDYSEYKKKSIDPGSYDVATGFVAAGRNLPLWDMYTKGNEAWTGKSLEPGHVDEGLSGIERAGKAIEVVSEGAAWGFGLAAEAQAAAAAEAPKGGLVPEPPVRPAGTVPGAKPASPVPEPPTGQFLGHGVEGNVFAHGKNPALVVKKFFMNYDKAGNFGTPASQAARLAAAEKVLPGSTPAVIEVGSRFTVMERVFRIGRKLTPAEQAQMLAAVEKWRAAGFDAHPGNVVFGSTAANPTPRPMIVDP